MSKRNTNGAALAAEYAPEVRMVDCFFAVGKLDVKRWQSKAVRECPGGRTGDMAKGVVCLWRQRHR